MKALPPNLRRHLEHTVADARDVAEAGARAALEALAVHEHEPYGHMDEGQRALRRRLRAHARQLGDPLDARSRGQGRAVGGLVQECAYEHWHGMLFARFLAENRLLIEPETGVAVTLDECEELAKEEGVDKWALAARYAHRMLPQVFRPDLPVFEVRFAREHRLKLEGLVEGLPADVFTATDSLGWVYQFWQSRKKAEVNRSEVKIGAGELPAVTQLFTEPYMVGFLLDNTLGAWWAARRLGDADVRGACGEAGLRRKAAIPGVPLDFLRFVQDAPASRLPRDPADTDAPTSGEAPPVAGERVRETLNNCSVRPERSEAKSKDALSHRERRLKPGLIRGSFVPSRGDDQATLPGWRPAAGAFRGWPEHLGEWRILDPCCGSGHFLVGAFSMLVPMRMAREGLAARDAVDAVLRDNLHGLELDPRCVELAVFALALAAWTYPGAEGYRPLPELDVACSGLAPNATREQWAALAELAASAGGMPPARDLFEVEDTLLSAPLRNSLDALHHLFGQAPEHGSLIDPHALEADLYQSDFESVRASFAAALERERMGDEQTEHAVAAQGMARAAELLAGRYHLVATNVPYLARGKQGEKLRAFCQRRHPDAKNDLATVFLERCLELCEERGTASLVLPQNWLFLTGYRKLREKLLKTETWRLLARLGPGAFETISGEVVKAVLLTLSRGRPAVHPDGLFDDASEPESGTMYGLDVSESRTVGEKAARLREAEVTGVEQARQLENPDARVALIGVTGELLEKHSTGHQGISTGDNPAMRRLFWEQPLSSRWVFFHSTVEETTIYGGMSSVLDWANAGRDMAALRGTAAWEHRGVAVSQIGRLSVTLYQGEKFDTNMSALPVVNERHLPAIWCFCSSPEYHDVVRRIDQKLNVTNATLVKVPFDLDHWTKVARGKYPHGLPRPYSDDPTQWIFHGHPCGSVVWDETGKRTAHGPLRTDPTVLQVAVARLLGYRWPAEQDPGMELADEQREWVRRCEPLHVFADGDGIVCIPPVRGEPSAAERIRQLLAAAFGDAWSDGTLSRLLAETGSPSLDDWLRNRFFEQHCTLFHHRPFVWHVWDGRKRDGFHALVNYHKLAEGGGKGRQCLEALTYSYLGDWVTRQQDGVNRGEGGAEDRLAAVLDLQRRLAAILEGEPPHDLFIRWKPIEAQPVGWEPDVNDGVRLNLRPFMAADLPGGKKDAGILRAKPNVHWRKDRGREPFREQERFPWFWRDGEFTGERVNGVHLSIAEKLEHRSRERPLESGVPHSPQANVSPNLRG